MQLVDVLDREKLRTHLDRWGPKYVGEVLAFDAANRLGYLEILRVMSLSLGDVDAPYLEDELPYEFRPLTPEEVERYAQNQEFDLHKYYRSALDNGDICFGVLDGRELASYGWYSRESTPITGEFRACFREQYVYMHHGFSHGNYRGKRLHAYGMARALQWLCRERNVELVSVVSVSNVDSLKSTQRLGYDEFGKVYIAGRFNTYLIYIDGACRERGFWVESTRDGYRTLYLRRPPF